MDLQELLREEHSKAHSLRIAELISDSESRFKELIKIVTGDDARLSQRGAWVVTCYSESYPEIVQPFLGALLQNLARHDLHDAVKRNTMKMAAELTLPEEAEGLAADIAFRFLASPEEPIAVRAHSMTVLEKLCHREPALAEEVRLTIRHQLPYEKSPGFRSRASRVLKTLDQLD